MNGEWVYLSAPKALFGCILSEDLDLPIQVPAIEARIAGTASDQAVTHDSYSQKGALRAWSSPKFEIQLKGSGSS